MLCLRLCLCLCDRVSVVALRLADGAKEMGGVFCMEHGSLGQDVRRGLPCVPDYSCKNCGHPFCTKALDELKTFLSSTTAMITQHVGCQCMSEQ